jgi:type II secretory pathway component PulJ
MKLAMRRRSGFSLVEVSVACVLTAFLAIMLSTTWRLLIPSTADLIVWGQLFQEMDIALATLGRDLGGSLPDNAQVGQKKVGRFLAARQNPSDGNVLELWFDGGQNTDTSPTAWSPLADDTVIQYYRDATSDALVRKNTKTARQFIAAKNLSDMSVTVPDADHLQIRLTFSSDVKATGKTLTRTCTLIAKKTP